jgi:hypothetical protein
MEHDRNEREDRAITLCRIWVFAMNFELHFLVIKGEEYREHMFRLLRPCTLFPFHSGG